MWALVPLKSLGSAKQRLSNTLSSAERRDLMLAMVRDVLSALKQAQQLTGVLIVSRTNESIALAQAFSTERFAESEGGNLSDALTEAAAYATNILGARGVMIIPGDIPLLTAAEIDAMLEQHEQVTVVPDSDHVGTNCLVCSPANCLTFQFDGRSFTPHLESAVKANLDPKVFESPGFGLDIDTPADLTTLLTRHPGSQTGTFLDKSGIAQRLKGRDNGATERIRGTDAKS